MIKHLINGSFHVLFARKIKCAILIFVGIFFSHLQAFSQEKAFSTYSDLSRFSLAKQKDSIKKAWTVPTIFKDKKTQNEYAEIWKSRTDFLLDGIEGNDFVYNKDIVDYVNGIITDLIAANKTLIQVQPLLLIDRNESVNAYAIGGNVLAINLGLLAYVNTREELALIIAHELSHNILNHTETAMRQKAELLTSEEYNNSLKNVLNSKYGRLSKLMEVLQTYSFSRSRHTRYKEGEADSLAIVLLNNAKIPFNADYFLRLDSTDNEYRTPLLQPAKAYFASFNLNLDDQWFVKKSKGLSSRNYNFSKGEDLSDSLKTHPECVERYNATKRLSTPAAVYTPVPESIHKLADKMIVWNLYNNMNLTPALYRILLIKDKGNNDPWYDVMVYNIFAALYLADKNLARFNSIGVAPKELISKDYFATQTMLEQIPASQLESDVKIMSALPFWSAASVDSRGFKAFLTSLISGEEVSKKQQALYSKEFLADYPVSIYAEIANKFK
ncbi:MAG: M48 family metalloprotease [Chitinophagaceae bacterium]